MTADTVIDPAVRAEISRRFAEQAAVSAAQAQHLLDLRPAHPDNSGRFNAAVANTARCSVETNAENPKDTPR